MLIRCIVRVLRWALMLQIAAALTLMVGIAVLLDAGKKLWYSIRRMISR